MFFSGDLDAWVVSHYADVHAVLNERGRFAPVTDGPGVSVLGGGFLQWSGREHQAKMGIVARRIRSPRALRDEVEHEVTDVVRTVTEHLPYGEQIDLREDCALWIPLLTTCKLVGFDEPLRLRQWYDTLTRRVRSSTSYAEAHAAGRDAMFELTALLGPILVERRGEPEKDLASDLVGATYDGRSWPDAEISTVIAQLFSATMETTERALTASFRELACDPRLSERMRDARRDREMLLSFGAEILRCYPPLQALSRVVLADTTLADVELKQGETIVTLVAAANRDEERFTDPEHFDPARFLPNPDNQYVSTGDILSFGGGEHHCTGSRLAGLIIATTLRHVLDRVERIELLEAAPDSGGLIFSSPSSLRVVLHSPTA